MSMENSAYFIYLVKENFLSFKACERAAHQEVHSVADIFLIKVCAENIFGDKSLILGFAAIARNETKGLLKHKHLSVSGRCGIVGAETLKLLQDCGSVLSERDGVVGYACRCADSVGLESLVRKGEYAVRYLTLGNNSVISLSSTGYTSSS